MRYWIYIAELLRKLSSNSLLSSKNVCVTREPAFEPQLSHNFSPLRASRTVKLEQGKSPRAVNIWLEEMRFFGKLKRRFELKRV